MFKNALSLMKKLRKIVLTDEDEIWIDYENKTFKRVRLAAEQELELPFPSHEYSTIGLLKYLHQGGYIVISSDNEYLTLTYKAFYYERIHRAETIQYIKRSILVPIFLTLTTNFILFLIKTAGITGISQLFQLFR